MSVKADGEGEREKVEQLLRDDFHLDLWKAKRKEGIYQVKSLKLFPDRKMCGKHKVGEKKCARYDFQRRGSRLSKRQT